MGYTLIVMRMDFRALRGGFLTPEEVAACYEKSRDSPPQPEMHPPTFAMLCGWIDEAHGRGEGLVGILM